MQGVASPVGRFHENIATVLHLYISIDLPVDGE